MKNRIFICLSLILMVIMLFMGIVTVFAETVAPTTPVSQPPVSEPVVTGTDATEVTGVTETTIAVSDPTETGVTTYPVETTQRPTEFASENAPATNSPYSPPDSMYDAPEYQGTTAVWVEIDENDVISLKNDTMDSDKSFSSMKVTSDGDEKDYTLIIIGIVLIAVSMVGIVLFIFTFVAKKPVPARVNNSATKSARAPQHSGTHSHSTRSNQPKVTSASGARVPDPEARAARRRRDDFNDGY